MSGTLTRVTRVLDQGSEEGGGYRRRRRRRRRKEGGEEKKKKKTLPSFIPSSLHLILVFYHLKLCCV